MTGKVDLGKKKQILLSIVPCFKPQLVKHHLLAAFDVEFLVALVLYSESSANVLTCLPQLKFFKLYILIQLFKLCHRLKNSLSSLEFLI